MTDVVLALDVGGTKLLGGLVTADGVVVLSRQVATPRDATGCDPDLAAFAGLAANLLTRDDPGWLQGRLCVRRRVS